MSLPMHTSTPLSLLNTLDVMAKSLSSCAIRSRSSEGKQIRASTSSPLVSQTPSRSHPVFYLRALPLARANETFHRCDSRLFLYSFFFFVESLLWAATPRHPRPVEHGVSVHCPGVVVCTPPLTSPQTSAPLVLSGSPPFDIQIDSQLRSDGLSNVIITSGDGSESMILDPVCTFSLLYPQVK